LSPPFVSVEVIGTSFAGAGGFFGVFKALKAPSCSRVLLDFAIA
jgi:hypothetical protein